MPKTDATVEDLVGMIQRGELRLPEMQRRYVWRSTRVRDLLDSLYRGYPSGAILVWETSDNIPLQEFAVQQQINPYGSTRLLLDGQQRLTSLSAVIRGEPVQVRERKKPIDILFNLDHPDKLEVVTEVVEDGPEEDDQPAEDEADSSSDELQQRFNRMTFVVATNQLEQHPKWVKVTDVFKTDADAPFLQRAGIERVSDPLYTKYSQRLSRLRGIKKYSYRVDVLERNLSYEEVTEIFVRVNSLGAKLRSSDLALAQITAKWRGSLKIFQDYQADCTKRGFDLDLGLHLKNMVAHATGQSRFQTVANIELETLKTSWATCVNGMDFALNFLRSNAGIESPALLSSPFILVTVSYYANRRSYQLNAVEEERLRFWVLVANAKGRYSRGSSESYLDGDLAILRQGGGMEELIDRVRQQVGRLDVSPDELEARNQRSALFKTMYMAFKAAGAKDWHSNLAISLDHVGSKHALQFHHIFPKAVLKDLQVGREADDIVNLAFIGGTTNRKISASTPAVYFPKVIAESGKSTFETQCIPTDDPALLEVAAYKSFLLKRRELIAARLNEFLGTVPTTPAQT